MATHAVRRLQPSEIRHFGSRRATHNIPDLTEIQTRFYDAFLQYDVPSNKRTARSRSSTCGTSSASPATARMSVGSCGSPTDAPSASICG
jgi:hypothetical protein